MANIKVKAKKYYEKLYHLPPNHVELSEFAESILKEFVDELRNNKRTVVWNYGLDSVVFAETMEKIMEEFINGKGDIGPDGSNEDDSTLTVGARTDGYKPGDSEMRGDYQLCESQEREIQERNKEENREADDREEQTN